MTERKDGLMQIRVKSWDGSEDHYLDFGEPAYSASVSDNYEFDTPMLRFVYTSLTTPMSTIDYDMASRDKTLLKEEEVLGGFEKNNYQTERAWTMARDGVRVPVSLVYRKGLFKRDGSNPMLLYGYGSYGATIDPDFSSSRLSLLDRGFVFAIAHVRGSQILGRQWYEDGKLLAKKHTFTDFVDSAQFLVDEGYTSPEGSFRSRRQRRRLAHGSCDQPRTRTLPRGHQPCAFCGCGDHHARFGYALDDQRIRRVG